ncbi:MAG TPA: hypothetical protein DEP87_04500, partial [Candidatus Pacebacteria bacterium]|nr:hypothetical protein [Candidatus Paceibacterota bacterium]
PAMSDTFSSYYAAATPQAPSVTSPVTANSASSTPSTLSPMDRLESLLRELQAESAQSTVNPSAPKLNQTNPDFAAALAKATIPLVTDEPSQTTSAFSQTSDDEISSYGRMMRQLSHSYQSGQPSLAQLLQLVKSSKTMAPVQPIPPHILPRRQFQPSVLEKSLLDPVSTP